MQSLHSIFLLDIIIISDIMIPSMPAYGGNTMNSFIIRNMPIELRQALKVKAAEAGKPMNQLIIEAIIRFVGPVKKNG